MRNEIESRKRKESRGGASGYKERDGGLKPALDVTHLAYRYPS